MEIADQGPIWPIYIVSDPSRDNNYTRSFMWDEIINKPDVKLGMDEEL